MKKNWGILCIVAAMTASFLTGCGGANNNGGADDGISKACLITSTPLGNEFIQFIWSGFETLERDGWKVKSVESSDPADQAEQIRAACAEGYNLIYTQGSDVMQSVLDISGELTGKYPNVHFFFLDTFEDVAMTNGTSVTVDPFESCFIAGYVAARRSNTKEIGLIMPEDTPALARFEFGYQAGVEHAGNGSRLVKAYTGDWVDNTKGYDAVTDMVAENNVDFLIQCAYTSGYGVIQACSDMGLPCIGLNSRQGNIDSMVFWSAVRPLDAAVVRTANAWADGETLPSAVAYTLRDGFKAYDDKDLRNLSISLEKEIVQLKDDIISGEVDIFAGKYEGYRPTAD